MTAPIRRPQLLAILLLVVAHASTGCHKHVSGKAAEDCTVRSADYRKWKLLDGECCLGAACGQGRADGVFPRRFRQPSYSGGFEDGYFHGQGRVVYANHDSYRGQWRAGMREGRGTLTKPDNTYRYDGQWRGDRRNGKGSEIWRDGRKKYRGEFENDKYHGQGTMTYQNGSVYRGQWRQGLRHGRGTMTYPDGRVVKGRWILGYAVRRIVGEAGRQAYACTRDEDCMGVQMPVCITGGCSPPCGHVRPMAPSALNRKRSAAYLQQLRKIENDKCQGIHCVDCAEPDPGPPDLGGFRAVCEEHRCTLAPRPDP